MGKKEEKPQTIKDKSLESSVASAGDFEIGPFIMVIFGGAGDLSRRKLLPALYHLYHFERFIQEFTILGVGLPEFSDEAYRRFVESAIKKFPPEDFDEKRCSEFSKQLYYLSGSLKDDSVYENLCQRLSRMSEAIGHKNSNLVFYLAVPPGLLPVIIQKLEKFKLCGPASRSKIIVEKPFGRDRESASALNRLILSAFEEKQIYRIDHYLGKETVQNILLFRFGNSIFEPLWNRRYIDHLQITVAEDMGIGHRGAFYEQVGVVRDIVQNHIMQLLALVGMEPPAGFEADLIRDEKVKVFHSIRPLDANYVEAFTVPGQYGPGRIGSQPVPGYREEENVSPGSGQATFFAGKFLIDNWRWAGIPFYVRTGKRLPRHLSEIYVQFKQPPLKLFGRASDVLEPNGLILSLQPEEEICLRLSVKYPGMGNEPRSVNMEFNYQKSFKLKQHPAYERLLVDCIKGDLTLFSREDGVELTWSVVDPIVQSWEKGPAETFPNYAAGTWGPKKADELMGREGRKWRVL